MVNFNKLLQDLNNKTDVYNWTLDNRFLKGKPWNFGARTYLKQIYTDSTVEKILLKGRQVEGSELSVNLVLHFLDTHPFTKVLYTFPNSTSCDTFCNDRIKQAFLQSSKLAAKLANDGSVKTKEFKNGSYLYFRTASSGGDKARGIDADMLVCDEYQDFEGGNSEDDTVPALDSLTSNLDASEHKRIITLGTPKLPNTHYSELWDTSTQNIWHVYCQQCQYKQDLSLDSIVNLEEALVDPEMLYKTYYGCLMCKAPLDRSIGEWVNTNPNSLRAGYHIPQLLVPTKRALDIVKAYGTKYHKGKTTRGFHNEVLGNFFAGSAIPFNDSILELCYNTSETVYSGCKDADGTYMGVDWGDITTVSIVKYDRKLDIIKVYSAHKIVDKHLNNHAVEVANLVRQYNVRNVVVDIGYGKPQTQELMKILPGRIWSCQSNGKMSQSEPYVFNTKTKVVLTDKNVAIAELVGRAELGHDRQGGLCIPYDDQARVLLNPYLREMQNIVARQQDNRTKYEKNNGKGDHFALALVYASMAALGDTRVTKHRMLTTGVSLGRRR